MYILQNVHTWESTSLDKDYSNTHRSKSIPRDLQHSFLVKVSKEHNLGQNTRRTKQEVSEVELTYSKNACAVLGCTKTVYKS